MDFGDGVTVNVSSSDEDCKSGKNGAPILSTSNRPELYAYSDTAAQTDNAKSNDGKKTGTSPVLSLLHPQAYEMLAQIQDSISKEWGGATDTTDSHSTTKSTITAGKDCNPDDVATKSAAKGQLLKIDLDDNLQNGRQNGQQQQQELATPQQQLQHRESISCGIEESTEVLLINSADYDDKHFGEGGGRSYSATDSDVEVLMSEEIGESDWSAGDTATGDHTPEDPNVELTTTNQPKQQNQISNVKALLAEAMSEEQAPSTHDDISVEMYSHSKSISINEPMDKENLLTIIGEQAASIHKLKSVVDHYRRAHLMLHKHAEAIQFTIDKTDEDLDKLGFPHRVKP